MTQDGIPTYTTRDLEAMDSPEIRPRYPQKQLRADYDQLLTQAVHNIPESVPVPIGASPSSIVMRVHKAAKRMHRNIVILDKNDERVVFMVNEPPPAK